MPSSQTKHAIQRSLEEPRNANRTVGERRRLDCEAASYLEDSSVVLVLGLRFSW